MTLLVIGADNIKAFVPKLNSLGAEEIIHWSGRNVQDARNVIPTRTDMVLFFTDFLNHNAAKAIKRQLKKRDLPTVYCRRAWSEIHQEMKHLAQRHDSINASLNGVHDVREEHICCGGKCRGGNACRCRTRNKKQRLQKTESAKGH